MHLSSYLLVKMAERSSAGTDFRFGAELTAPQILIFNTPGKTFDTSGINVEGTVNPIQYESHRQRALFRMKVCTI